MGGHGALTLYLASKTKQYRSASAFSPICNPTKCPWGEKAFKGYLQSGIEEAKTQYDATELIAKTTDSVHILIDYVGNMILTCTDFTYLLSCRALVTTFISKGNFCQRIS